MEQTKFKREIKKYYRLNKRDFSWRRTRDPYRIVVSELMLQQTQTHRVEPKYREFLDRFPTFEALAAASVPEVLDVWQGLGYNRRALYLKKIAQAVTGEYEGILPWKPERLQTLPGIGPNTAGSIAAFAFNKPVVFIETNIRRVFLHFFFAGRKNIHDKKLVPLISETLDVKNPREWYFALMDYGAMLAKKVPNPNRRSRHYQVQSKFAGSNRQARGLILKMLLRGPENIRALVQESGREKKALEKILSGLQREGFIKKIKNSWRLAV